MRIVLRATWGAAVTSPIPAPAITEELLQELRRLLEAATPGPLTVPDMPGWTQRRAILDERGGEICDGPYERIADLRCLAALRNAAPSLLAAAARLKETEARCKALRLACIWVPTDGSFNDRACRLCWCRWNHDEAEQHAKTCPARPLPESQR